MRDKPRGKLRGFCLLLLLLHSAGSGHLAKAFSFQQKQRRFLRRMFPSWFADDMGYEC
jgi:hypothetical protein